MATQLFQQVAANNTISGDLESWSGYAALKLAEIYNSRVEHEQGLPYQQQAMAKLPDHYLSWVMAARWALWHENNRTKAFQRLSRAKELANQAWTDDLENDLAALAP